MSSLHYYATREMTDNSSIFKFGILLLIDAFTYNLLFYTNNMYLIMLYEKEFVLKLFNISILMTITKKSLKRLIKTEWKDFSGLTYSINMRHTF
jgi:hypothetical protein